MSGLEPVVFLAKSAKVMLTMNLSPDVGLCNGATGMIIDFIYHVNHQSPDLPVAVIVQFDDYRGPSISNTLPICPVTISLLLPGSGIHERQQLPLRLAYALTLPKAWIDIGKTKKSPGITYVALSRVQNLSSCVIEPMSFERLTALKSSKNLTFRLQKEERLDHLAQATAIAFNH